MAFYAWFRDDPAQHPAANEAERRLIVEGRRRYRRDGLHAHGPIPWLQVFRYADIWLLGGAMFTMAAIYNVLVNWYPKYLQAARGATPKCSRAGWRAWFWARGPSAAWPAAG